METYIPTNILELKDLGYVTEVITPDINVDGYGEDIQEDDVTKYITQVIPASEIMAILRSNAGLQIVTLTDGQYDPISKLPTIQTPKVNTIYVVPNGKENGANKYIEWIYINGAVEEVGYESSISTLSKEDLDNIFN